jgi:hypothetical protein
MDGYVMNVSSGWAHAMKRAVGPGAKVPINELYEQYGIKHGISEGEDFVKWLRSVKLRDTNRWKIVCDAVGSAVVESKGEVEIEKKKGHDMVTPMVKTKMEVKDIVELSVRDGRQVLPTITDLNLLKYALQEANQLSGKDSLCIIIRKRIKELQLGR